MESIEATQQRLDESVFSMNTERDLYLQQEAIVSSRLHQLPIRERSVIKTTTPNREQTLNDLATERTQLRIAQRSIREKLDAIIDAESGILREYRDLEERIVVQSALASTKRLQLQNAKETKARAVKINALLEEQKETPRLRTPPKPQTNKKRIATQKSPEKQEECSICLIPDIERSPWWIDERVRKMRRRSNVAVIIVRVIFISSFLFYCLFYNYSFQTKPNSVTNCFKLFFLLQLYKLHLLNAFVYF